MANKTYLTKEGATKHLGVFIKNTPGDYVSREDLLIASGKNPNDPRDYNKWFGYMMTAMGEYGLFTKVAGTLKSGQKGIVGIRLTDEGKKAVGRSSAGAMPPETPGTSAEDLVTLPQIEGLVGQWERQNRGWTILVEPRKIKEVTPT